MFNHCIISNSTDPEMLPHPLLPWGTTPFHLRSREAKTQYLMASVLGNLPPLQRETRDMILRGLFPDFSTNPGFDTYGRTGQILVLPEKAPMDVRCATLDLDFIRALHGFLMQDNISIQEMTDEAHGTPVFLGINTRAGAPGRATVLSRKEKDGWFTLFHRGGPVCYTSFTTGQPFRPAAPELVTLDLDANAAPALQQLVDQLRLLRVFEVTVNADTLDRETRNFAFSALRQGGFFTTLETTSVSATEDLGNVDEFIIYNPPNTDVRRLEKRSGGEHGLGVGEARCVLGVDLDFVHPQTFHRIIRQAQQHNSQTHFRGSNVPGWMREWWCKTSEIPTFSLDHRLLPKFRPMLADSLRVPCRFRGSDGVHGWLINPGARLFGPSKDKLTPYEPENLVNLILSSYASGAIS